MNALRRCRPLGPCFTLPPEATSADLPNDGHAAILATNDQLYLVVSDQKLNRIGQSTVSGYTPVKDNQRTITHPSGDSIEATLLLASSVTYDTPTDATLQEVTNTPKQYSLESVRVEGTSTTLPARLNLGSNVVSTPVTAGVLTSQSPQTPPFAAEPGQKVADFMEASEQRDAPGWEKIVDYTGEPQDRAYTLSFGTQFAVHGESTVTAVVVTPDSPAIEAATFGVGAPPSDAPLLYTVSQEMESEPVDSVESLKTGEYSGEVVEVTTDSTMTTLRTQEALRSAGAPLPHDTLLHSGVMGDSVEESLPIIGISSAEQEPPVKTESGEYRLVGKVVSSDRVSSSIPHDRVFVVYEAERLDDRTISEDAKQVSTTLSQTLRSQLLGQSPPEWPTANQPSNPTDVDESATRVGEPINEIEAEARAAVSPVLPEPVQQMLYEALQE